MKMSRLVLCLVALGVVVLSRSALAVPQFYVDSDRFTYTGTVTAYNSLTDAQQGSNAQATYALDQTRDLSLYQSQQYPGDTNSNIIMTNWYSQVVPGPLGTGNPNNVADGFTQLYDNDASTVGSASGYWTSDALNQFALHVSGENALAGDDFSRLWNGTGNDSGTFLSYTLEMVMNFDAAATLDGNGFYMLEAEPNSVLGTFSGIFQGTDSLFYTFNTTIGLDGNWAWSQRENLLESFDPSVFGSATVVPEPMTLLLTGIGLAGLGLRRRFRRQ
jgi:hypothetical protein